uniref:(California timema) hypothetical protein n=1 Tax=Timema californicum TaxID=61474 RepID=A0A7R9J0X5_TIMCA|nr:unnamed protein product [Timema californicum]
MPLDVPKSSDPPHIYNIMVGEAGHEGRTTADDYARDEVIRRLLRKPHPPCGSLPPRREVTQQMWKTTRTRPTPFRDSNIDLRVTGILVYWKGGALDHAATKTAMLVIEPGTLSSSGRQDTDLAKVSDCNCFIAHSF